MGQRQGRHPIHSLRLQPWQHHGLGGGRVTGIQQQVRGASRAIDPHRFARSKHGHRRRRFADVWHSHQKHQPHGRASPPQPSTALGIEPTRSCNDPEQRIGNPHPGTRRGRRPPASRNRLTRAACGHHPVHTHPGGGIPQLGPHRQTHRQSIGDQHQAAERNHDEVGHHGDDAHQMETFHRHRPRGHQGGQASNTPAAQTPFGPFPNPSRARPLRGRQQAVRTPRAMFQPPSLPPRRKDRQSRHHQERQQETRLEQLPRLSDQDEQRRQRQGIEQVAGAFQHPRSHHHRGHHRGADGRGLPSGRRDVEPNQRQRQPAAQCAAPSQHPERLHQQDSDQGDVQAADGKHMQGARTHEPIIDITGQTCAPAQGHGPDQSGGSILGQTSCETPTGPFQKTFAPRNHIRRARPQSPIPRSFASHLQSNTLTAKEGGVIEQARSHRTRWRGNQAGNLHRLPPEKTAIGHPLTAHHHLARSRFPRTALRAPTRHLQSDQRSLHPLTFALRQAHRGRLRQNPPHPSQLPVGIDAAPHIIRAQRPLRRLISQCTGTEQG